MIIKGNIPNNIKLALLLMFITISSDVIDSYLQGGLSDPSLLMLESKELLIRFFFYLFVAYNIIHKQNWARILLLVFYSVSMYMYIGSLCDIGIDVYSLGDERLMIVSILKHLLQVSSLIILFSGKSNKWFNSSDSEENLLESAK